jgi:hypothetical protein
MTVSPPPRKTALSLLRLNSALAPSPGASRPWQHETERSSVDKAYKLQIALPRIASNPLLF